MNKFWIYLANIVKSNMVLKPKGDLKFRKNKYRQLLGKFHREVENKNKKLLTKVNLCTRHLKEMKILK